MLEQILLLRVDIIPVLNNKNNANFHGKKVDLTFP